MRYDTDKLTQLKKYSLFITTVVCERAESYVLINSMLKLDPGNRCIKNRYMVVVEQITYLSYQSYKLSFFKITKFLSSYSKYLVCNFIIDKI